MSVTVFSKKEIGQLGKTVIMNKRLRGAFFNRFEKIEQQWYAMQGIKTDTTLSIMCFFDRQITENLQ